MQTINASQGSTIIPSARYHDAKAAIEWLCDVLGFAKHAVYEGSDGIIEHAELTLGKGMFMLGSAQREDPYQGAAVHPEQALGRVTSPFYVIVSDCCVVEARAKALGATILQPLKTMDYGGAAITLRDPEGYIWSVGEYDPWAAHTAAEA